MSQVSSNEEQNDVETVVNQIELLRRGFFLDKAEILAREAVATFPENVDTRIALGRVMLASQSVAGARCAK